MTDLNANRSPSHDDPSPAFEFGGDKRDSEIWTAAEIAILRSHVQGYRAAAHKKKTTYVQKVVILEIKAAWNGRYARKRMKKDSSIQEEWDKKKNVSNTNNFVLADQPAVTANLQVVWEQRVDHTGIEDPRVQFNRVLRYRRERQKERRN